MRTYDFSGVDFSQPEIMASLARAYAILLQAEPGQDDDNACEAGTEEEQSALVQPNKQPSTYTQLRLF